MEEMCQCKKTSRPENMTKSIDTRLNKIEGQVKGIKGMLERDAYCDDILTQISSVQSALGSVAKLILEHHIHNCVKEKIEQGDEEIIDELMVTFSKMLKL